MVVGGGEIVGDVDDRDAEIVAQRLEQVDDGHAQRGIDHRHRLVGNDQLWVGKQRAGDGDALQLSAGKLVRIAVTDLLQREPDLAQRAVDGDIDAGLIARGNEPPPGREQIAVELLQRVEGFERILEDRLHLVHEGHAVGATPHGGEIDAVEHQTAAGGHLDIQDHPRQRGLAAAGFADHREDLGPLCVELKADVVDGLNAPAREQSAPAEGLADMSDVEKR